MFTNIRLEQFGHIGKIKVETINGKKLARVSLASKTRSKDKHTGQVKEYADWLEWTFFGEKTVEFIERHAGKGQYVRIEGKARQSSYEKNGQKVYTTEVLGFRFDFCEPKGDDNDGGYEPGDEEIPY
ncbi:MAG: single-stranded DNA-binding protein [Magnetospirillum sp.]|nr:single-stranded DNA-binding protein [Magnetospirillum sp.]